MVNRQHADFTARERISQNSPRRLVTLGIAELSRYYRSIGEIGVEVAGREGFLRDLIIDEVVIRDVFRIDEKEDIATAAIKVLDRLHVIGDAFTRFAAYFVRECCKK